MSQGELRIKIVESTNSETFREFLEEIRRDRPRLFMVLDNASYSDTPKFVPRKMHQTENFVDRFIL